MNQSSTFLTVLLALTVHLSALQAAPEDIARVGDAAPAFVAKTDDGGSFDLSAQKGKVVLINFFATWCGPCKVEMPALENKVWKAHRDKGLVLVAVGREHSVEEVAAFKAQNQLSFPLLADKDRGIYSKYAVKLIPRCYLIGKDGTVKFATVGFSGERDEKFPLLLQAIEQELAR